jgi:pilus assembly protein Flp/PilA
MRFVTRRNPFLSRFLGDDAGATAIEYTIIAAGIALAIIAAVNAIGVALAPKYLAAGAGLN